MAFGGASCLASVMVAGVVIRSNPGPTLAAAEVVTTTSSGARLAAEWGGPTTTTSGVPVPVPESVPTSVAPLWVSVRVTVPGWDGLGKLVTDGHRAGRILPGQLGRSVIAIDADPSQAATVVVEGREWRVFHRGSIGANQLDVLTGPRPIVPTVVIVSTLPGDLRPYIEAREL